MYKFVSFCAGSRLGYLAARHCIIPGSGQYLCPHFVIAAFEEFNKVI